MLLSAMAGSSADPPDVAIAAARRGSPEGIARLYGLYATDLLRAALRVTGSLSDAEDVVHDLFVGLPQLLGRYHEQGQLAAWLNSIVIRLAIAKARKDSRREFLLSQFWVTATPNKCTNSALNFAIDLDQALSALPFSLRSVFVLRFYEDQSYEEVAAELSITPGAARVRYLRALRHLRRLIHKSP
jgi:RNA polymerase sigma factor (sigma-70 family)